EVFTEMTAAIEAAGGVQQPLLLNFRSQKPLIHALNLLFARVFQCSPEVPANAVGELGYVDHESSTAVREAENEPPHVEFILSAISEDEESNGSPRYRRSSFFSAQERDADQVAARVRALVTGDESGNADSSLARSISKT